MVVPPAILKQLATARESGPGNRFARAQRGKQGGMEHPEHNPGEPSFGEHADDAPHNPGEPTFGDEPTADEHSDDSPPSEIAAEDRSDEG